MEPKFQTSFIPKKPIVDDVGVSVGVVRETNIFSIIASIFFVLSLLAMGGLYAGKMVLTKQIAVADEDIKKQKDAFQVDEIKNLIDSNDRILSAKSLVEGHISLSPLLSLLQQLTVKRIRIIGLNYANKAGVPVLTLTGEALNYNALTDQSRIFSESSYMSNNKFSNFVLEDNGYIKVDFVTAIDTNLVSYKKAIDSLSSTTPTQ